MKKKKAKKIKKCPMLGCQCFTRIPFSYNRVGRIVEPAVCTPKSIKEFKAKQKRLERIRKALIKKGLFSP